MRFNRCLVHAAAALLPQLLAASAEAPKIPDYYPLCSAPQLLAPPQFSGGSRLSGKVSAAWTGREFGTVYADGDNALYFRRIYADGTPAGPAAPIVASAWTYDAPSIAWNGSEYGIVWLSYLGPNYFVYFQRLTAAGALIGTPTQVSSAAIQTITYPTSISLVWNGSGYAVAWQDSRTFGANSIDIYATLLNADGTIAGPAGAWHDLVIASTPQQQSLQNMAWSPVAARYVIVWADFRNAPKIELWESLLNPADGTFSGNVQLVTSTGNASSPHLVSAGNGLGLTWTDNRDGNNEVYFARLNNNGAKLGTDLRVTNDAAQSRFPAIAWTGAEYGLFWEEGRGGNDDIWFQRISAGGVLQGSNQQVSFTADLGMPSPIFGQYGYLFFGSPFQTGVTGPAQVQPLACNYDYDPPTCAQNLVAYNITGTSATISWIPSVENYTDVAYYEIYRNSVLQGRSANPVYSDSGLSLNSTYNYYVRPVNAAQMVNGSCTNSVYVKTGASLTLTMNKSTPDAVLNWTDAGMNSYNVFRGTGPQVMQQIGQTPALTAQDANALTDSLNYFYTVDDPGE